MSPPEEPNKMRPPGIGRSDSRADQVVELAFSRFEALAKATGDIVWEWDLTSGNISGSSDIQPSFARWLGEVHPDDRVGFLDTLNNHLAGQTSWFNLEYRLRSHNTYRWVADRGRTELGSDHKPTKVIGFRTDLDDRRHWESQITQELAAIQTSCIANQVAILSADLADPSQFWTAGWHAVLGLDESTLKLPDLPDLVAIEGRRRFEHALRDVTQVGEEFESEFDFVHSNESPIPALVRMRRVGTTVVICVVDLRQRRALELESRRTQALVQASLEATADALLMFDAVRSGNGKIVDFTVRYANRQSEMITRTPVDQVLGRAVSQSLTDPRLKRGFVLIRRAVKLRSEEFKTIKVGSRWLAARAVPLDDSVALAVTDVTPKRQADDLLRNQERYFQSLSKVISDVTCLDDVTTGHPIFASRPLMELLGWELGPPVDSISQLKPYVTGEDRATLESIRLKVESGPAQVEVRALAKDGTVRWISIRAQVFQRDSRDRPSQLLFTYRDVTETKEHLEVMRRRSDELERENLKLQRLATTDALTGVYNRREFQERLRSEADRARRYGNALSLVITDIDDFKLCNDRYGHPFGDEVLRAFAQIVSRCARTSDVVARYGGEEFAIILPETTVDDAAKFAERVRTKLQETEIGEHRVKVTGSFGCAQYIAGPNAAEDLVQRADAVQYKAKRDGKDRVYADRVI